MTDWKDIVFIVLVFLALLAICVTLFHMIRDGLYGRRPPTLTKDAQRHFQEELAKSVKDMNKRFPLYQITGATIRRVDEGALTNISYGDSVNQQVLSEIERVSNRLDTLEVVAHAVHALLNAPQPTMMEVVEERRDRVLHIDARIPGAHVTVKYFEREMTDGFVIAEYETPHSRAVTHGFRWQVPIPDRPGHGEVLVSVESIPATVLPEADRIRTPRMRE